MGFFPGHMVDGLKTLPGQQQDFMARHSKHSKKRGFKESVGLLWGGKEEEEWGGQATLPVGLLNLGGKNAESRAHQRHSAKL